MCASYGLDPRIGDYKSFLAESDAQVVADLAAWAQENSARTLKPTGIKERLLLPHIPMKQGPDDPTVFVPAWWGYLVGGQSAKFPSINTKSERVKEQSKLLASRGIAPASTWFEMQKPSRDWYEFSSVSAEGKKEQLAIATVTRAGVPEGGEEVTCYSLIMQPAREDLAHIHDRMPLLLPTSFVDEWLDPRNDPSRELIEAALDAGREVTDRVAANLRSSSPLAAPKKTAAHSKPSLDEADPQALF